MESTTIIVGYACLTACCITALMFAFGFVVRRWAELLRVHDRSVRSAVLLDLCAHLNDYARWFNEDPKTSTLLDMLANELAKGEGIIDCASVRERWRNYHLPGQRSTVTAPALSSRALFEGTPTPGPLPALPPGQNALETQQLKQLAPKD